MVTVTLNLVHSFLTKGLSAMFEVWVGPTRLSYDQNDFDSKFVSELTVSAATVSVMWVCPNGSIKCQ